VRYPTNAIGNAAFQKFKIYNGFEPKFQTEALPGGADQLDVVAAVSAPCRLLRVARDLPRRRLDVLVEAQSRRAAVSSTR
jgi:hypothetical protein